MGWREAQEWVRAHRRAVVVASILGVLFLILSGTKLFLYINFLLGNDIVVQLSADKEHLSLLHGEEENVTFAASVATNPFCKAVCSSRFEDLSSGQVLDADTFTLRPTQPVQHEYTIMSERDGHGQALYRFSMECSSRKTALCETDEEPTVRSILVTVAYDLNDAQRLQKQDLEEQFRRLASSIGALQRERAILLQLAQDLSIGIDSTEPALEERNSIESLWASERYAATVPLLERADRRAQDAAANLSATAEFLEEAARMHNGSAAQLRHAAATLEWLRSLYLTNASHATAIQEAITQHNAAVSLFDADGSLQHRSAAARLSAANASVLAEAVVRERNETALRKTIAIDLAEDLLCAINNTCLPHPNMSLRATQAHFDLQEACDRVDLLHRTYESLNVSGDGAGVPAVAYEIIAGYLLQLPPDSSIARLLPRTEPGNHTERNTTLLLAGLRTWLPEPCITVNASYNAVAMPARAPVTRNESIPSPEPAILPVPRPICCLKGNCEACCTDTACREDPAHYPVIFLHGHAFNKDTSADYSLDAFNRIQERMEEDGYVNLGAISLYTQQDTPEGSWGMVRAPMTAKASYYFDLFHEPENYIVVQTKSENIETYAVRLKDLIETVQYKTGRPKVTIVAHSMGGLVARRYLQLFGTGNVDRLIMIGTPNQGIVGEVAEYCPLVGERLECRDMNADSLFLNKLNRGRLPGIPITMIIGTGCAMEEGDGDGIVLSSHAYLPGARNVYVNGNCTPSRLHSAMLDIDRYPQTYHILSDELKKR